MSSDHDAPAEQLNRAFRADKQPSAATTAALQEIVRTGSLGADARRELVDELFEAVAARASTDPPSTGVLAERIDDGVRVRVESELWRRQPLGVICRPVHHRVNGEGSALLADVYPRSDTVAADVFPADHVALDVVPVPVWLERFVGENGYAPLDDGE